MTNENIVTGKREERAGEGGGKEGEGGVLSPTPTLLVSASVAFGAPHGRLPACMTVMEVWGKDACTRPARSLRRGTCPFNGMLTPS